MAAHRELERHASLLAEIVGGPDVIQGIELKHEMMQPLGHPRLPECDRVMAWITMQEGDVEARFNAALGLWLHPVTHAHTQNVAVKLKAALHVVNADSNVPEAHPRRDKTADRPRRLEGNIDPG